MVPYDNSMNDDAPLFCARCLARLQPGDGNFFVVHIEAVADPTPPSFTHEDLQRDFNKEFNRLVEELSDYSERELMDQVHRQTTIHLCNQCFARWIENPTGES